MLVIGKQPNRLIQRLLSIELLNIKQQFALNVS